ncbi:hypothetical protein B0T10DRAFT_455045 [Thelonectria olida]|uniref:Uncharacterized protein n=1 Tax=Thelonectria olida TaxID=1576542 RepID=A0A9P8WDZ7_9HYPO|nr:hypothetical protein B0T10DRAFT_455045 [Thelonectria olida]
MLSVGLGMFPVTTPKFEIGIDEDGFVRAIQLGRRNYGILMLARPVICTRIDAADLLSVLCFVLLLEMSFVSGGGWLGHLAASKLAVLLALAIVSGSLTKRQRSRINACKCKYLDNEMLCPASNGQIAHNLD